jgi:hypothetical protein
MNAMALSLVLLGSLLLAGAPPPTPEQIEKKLENEAKADPNAARALQVLKENRSRIKAAEAMKGHKPKTCEDKCDFMEKESTGEETPMVKGKPVSKAAKKAMDKNMKEMAKVCRDSCFAKGKIDKDYMKEHMPKASSPYPSGGQKPGGGGGGGGGDSSSSDSQ